MSGAVKPTGQAHHRVRLPEQIKPIDKDRRRSGEPQLLGLGVGVNPSEPNIDCGSTDGIEGMPQPLPYDRQAGAALDEPDFNVHPSILRLLAACRRDSGLCLVVGPLGATAADAALSVVFVEVLRAGAEGVGVGQHGVDLPLLTRRAGHPDLVLGGEATGGADLLVGEQALAAEPGDLGVHGVAGLAPRRRGG